MSELHEYLEKAFKEVDLLSENPPEEVPVIDIDAEIRELIISSRNKAGYTQQELANRAHITQANLSKIENGNQKPSILILNRIAKSLDKRLVIDFVDPWEGE